MSFEFPRPVPESRYSHYYDFMQNPEPDYDELLVRLSLYAFNRLSPGDKRKQVEEIRQNVNVEDVEEQSLDEAFRLTSFAELFKKLNFSEQRHFLSKVTRKFKRERQLGELMSSFQQLDAKHQQQLIEKIVQVTPENLQNPGETEEDFRLRRFTQLSRDYTDHVYKLVVARKKSDRDQQEETSDNENGSDCFAEFFLGSSIVWFQGQSSSGQDRVVEQLSRGVRSSVVIENRLPHESEEDFKLRRFTQLSRYYTDYIYKLVVAWKKSDQDQQEETSINKNGSDCFSEFFLGFSIVWFQGQSSSSQDQLTEQLSREVGSRVVTENRLPHESEEDFKLRRFTELCKQVVDFGVQENFLENAGKKLKKWQLHSRYRLIVEPKDSDSAAGLLSRLSCFGFSLLPAMYQQKKIDEMSNQAYGVEIETSPAAAADEEGIRMTRFKALFNQVPVRTRIDLLKELRKMLLQEKHYSEAVRFFRGLGSEDQTDMIEKLSDEITMYHRCDPAELIIEKFSGESEEDFRLRRYEKVCSKHLSTWGYIVWPEADRERVRQVTAEESPYAKFLFDVSITWFKARCGNYRRNPIHVILFGQVEFRDVIQKLPDESEEDFKLRRFTESFKQLEFTHQVQIVDYIQHTLFGDLGHSERKEEKKEEKKLEGRGPFYPEWIKMKLPVLRDQGAAAAITQGATTTSQAGGGGGGGGGQGTSQP